MEKLKFSVLENFRITKTASEDSILKGLKGDIMKLKVEPLRKLIAAGKYEEASNLKKQLPAIMTSGVFSKRLADGLLEYNKIVCLDLDKVEAEKLQELKKQVEECDYTYLTFVSPSGNGLKIWVRINSDATDHKSAFIQVCKHYETLLNIKFDEKTSDINRLTFMSYDPDYYYYGDSKIFNVVSPEPIRPLKQPLSVNLEERNIYKEMCEKAYNIVNKKDRYEEGNRNNFIFKVASICNKFGIPAEEVEHNLYWSTLPASEIKQILKSAYSNKNEFGNWDWKITYSETKSQEESKDFIEDINFEMVNQPCEDVVYNIDAQEAEEIEVNTSPYIPDEVFKSLPKILKDMCAEVEDKRQKDILLLSSLGVISSMLPNVYGNYDDSFGTNLYVFILGPAGTGKGIVKKSREIANGIQQQVSKDKKSLIIPANNSMAMITKMMAANENFGIIHETEADTLANALKSEHGDFSQTLRSAFHHDPISYSRKTTNEHITIEKPSLSVVLSGTHNQVINTIKNVEDGLFSRFLFYLYHSDPVWKNQRIKGKSRLNELIKKSSIDFLKLWNKQENVGSILVDLQPHQEMEFNSFFEAKLLEYIEKYGNEVSASINRHGLMCFKIAIILSVLREIESTGSLKKELLITNADFQIAINIIQTSLVHMGHVRELFGSSKISKLNYHQQLVYQSIPYEYTRKDYDSIAAKNGVKYKTAEKYLNDFKRHGLIKSIGHGKYKKVA